MPYQVQGSQYFLSADSLVKDIPATTTDLQIVRRPSLVRDLLARNHIC